jgi:hypothetical protein
MAEFSLLEAGVWFLSASLVSRYMRSLVEGINLLFW